MPPRKFVDQVSDVVADLGGSATLQEIADKLQWDVPKVKGVVDQANAELCGTLYYARGGRVLYTGSEIKGSEILYREVARIVLNYWAAQHGLHDPEVAITARVGERHGGAWTHPDLIATGYRRGSRRLLDPRLLHSFEVEQRDGFDVRSVYQAHCHGLGAAFSWVAFPENALVEQERDRVMWAAGALGVGLISYRRPGSWTTWSTVVNAQDREPTPSERAAFVATVGVAV